MCIRDSYCLVAGELQEKSTEMTAKDVFDLSPGTLCFSSPLDRQIFTSLKITNNDLTQDLAYRIKTTQPLRYFVKPWMSIMGPGEIKEISVEYRGHEKNRCANSETIDKFRIDAILLPKNQIPPLAVEEIKALFNGVDRQKLIIKMVKTRFVEPKKTETAGFFESFKKKKETTGSQQKEKIPSQWNASRHTAFSTGDTDYKGALHITIGFTPTKRCSEYTKDAAIALGVPATHIDVFMKECLRIAANICAKHGTTSPLTPQQIFAITAFTYEIPFVPKQKQFYLLLNDVLRARNNAKLLAVRGYLFFLLQAMDALPDWSGTVFRGIPKKDLAILQQKYVGGGKVHWSAFSSTTTNASVAAMFAGSGGARFQIKLFGGKQIKEFSAMPLEDEIVVPPNTAFLVVTPLQKQQDGSQVLELAQFIETVSTFVF
eukprot:TRINITY_DN2437_c0_g1_i1.p1 TRINITY_DN2437_c0_g1~~TRINITY_DN2437_c0_g1_i1.p1  ORF type:complete len:430 (+),score=79.91 TRINITY_DN2437_c0_g1_i1:37-1326(+)